MKSFVDFMATQCEPWQVNWGNKTIYGGRLNSREWGTWICEEGHEPKRLLEGAIAHQLVTPDNHWLVGTIDKKLICFDLIKRKMSPIEDAEAVNSFYAIDYLPTQKQVLLVCPGKAGTARAKTAAALRLSIARDVSTSRPCHRQDDEN